jgi:flagellar FliL protein
MKVRRIITGATIVLLAGASAAVFCLRDPDRAGVLGKLVRAARQRQPPQVTYVDVKEMTMRLADTGTDHYVKLTPVFAVLVPSAEEFENKTPVLRDRIVTVVTARTSAELATPAGEAKLKRDIIEALRGDFRDGVVDVYFSGYLVE